MNIWKFVFDKFESMLNSHGWIIFKLSQRNDKSLFVEIDKSGNLTNEMIDDIINSYQKQRKL